MYVCIYIYIHTFTFWGGGQGVYIGTLFDANPDSPIHCDGRCFMEKFGNQALFSSSLKKAMAR